MVQVKCRKADFELHVTLLCVHLQKGWFLFSHHKNTALHLNVCFSQR